MPTTIVSAESPPQFAPQAPGINEQIWTEILAAAPRWDPPDRPLVVVSPHPDDEVLGAGGLIHTWVASGRAVTIVSVTDGEAAYENVGNLAPLRRKELSLALRKLTATHVPIVRLGLPDGRVREHGNRLRNALLDMMSHDATLIAPFEHDGHPDHDSTGAICLEVAKACNAAIVRYLIWRWHHGDATALRGARWAKFHLSTDARRAKSTAVQCFASQLAPRDATPIIPEHVLRYFERSHEAFLL